MKKQDVNKVIKKKKKAGINKDLQSSFEIQNESDLVNLQQQYSGAYLGRLHTAAVIKELRLQLKKEVPDVKWWGMPYPKDILVIEHDIEVKKYKEIRMSELGFKKQLIQKGITEKQLTDLLNGGAFIKQVPKTKNNIPDYVG